MRRLISAIAVLALLAGLIVWAFLPRPVEVEMAEVALRTLEVAVEEEGEARIREVFTISATIGGQAAADRPACGRPGHCSRRPWSR